VLLGTLNHTSLLLGDYYLYALDGDIYPLASLNRTNINRLLRAYFRVPVRLRDVSPWQQKVRPRRGQLGEEHWTRLERQNSDNEEVLLPRNFYRMADVVLNLWESGLRWDKIPEHIIKYLKEEHEMYGKLGEWSEQTDDVITWMVKTVQDLIQIALWKYKLNEHKLPKVSTERQTGSLL